MKRADREQGFPLPLWEGFGGRGRNVRLSPPAGPVDNAQ